MSESKWWVGQRVHACGHGQGEVVDVRKTGGYPVGVGFHNQVVMFTEGGKRHVDDHYPTLFPVDTDRPKAKVKKRIEGWVNIYTTCHSEMEFVGNLYQTEKDADEGCSEARRGPACHIIHEWEE